MIRSGHIPRSLKGKSACSTMVPHTPATIAAKLTRGKLRDIGRVTSGFYISNALEFTS